MSRGRTVETMHVVCLEQMQSCMRHVPESSGTDGASEGAVRIDGRRGMNVDGN